MDAVAGRDTTAGQLAVALAKDALKWIDGHKHCQPRAIRHGTCVSNWPRRMVPQKYLFGGKRFVVRIMVSAPSCTVILLR